MIIPIATMVRRLAPFLYLPTEDDGVQAALLETGGTVLTVMMVMMMLCHNLSEDVNYERGERHQSTGNGNPDSGGLTNG